MKKTVTLKSALSHSMLLLIMLLGFNSQALSQEIVQRGSDDPFIRVELMGHSYFTRMVMVSEFNKIKDAKVVTSEEEGIVYIYPSINKVEAYLADIKTMIAATLKREKKLSKDEQTIELQGLIAEYGDWLEHYALTGQRNVINDSCHKSLPFCTNTIYTFPAGVNTQAQVGPNYNCLNTRPNPAWYHLKILDPGPIGIYMYSTPSRDIDFCLWGPFADPVTPCPMNNSNGGLTGAKVVDCSYSPSPTETANIPNGQTGQYYILIITNYSNNPCNVTFQQNSGTGSTDCTILPPPATSNSPLCVGGTLSLSAATVIGAQYQWAGPNGFLSNQQNPQIPNVQFSNAGIYSLAITVGGQTSDPTNTEVFVYDPPTASLSGTSSICVGDSTKLTITATSVGPYRATITSGVGGLPQVLNFWQTPYSFWVHPTTTTTYNITSIMNNACAGTVSGSATVTVKQRPSPAFTTENTCNQQPTQFTDQTTVPVGGIASWDWNFGDLSTSNLQNPSHTYANAGTYNVQLVVTGNNGCGGQSIITPLSIKQTPNINAGPDKTIPYGTTTTLDATVSGGGSHNYQWQPADKVNNANILVPTTIQLAATTDFTLTATDPLNGCKKTDEVKVNITGGPLAATIQSDKPDICIGASTLLNAQVSGGSSNYTFSWTSNPPGFTSSNEDITVNPVVTTTYLLSVYDGFNTINAQYQVIVNPSPQPNAGIDQTIPHGTTAILTSQVSSGTPPFTYVWAPADLLVAPTMPVTPTRNIYSTQDFSLKVTDIKGCIARDTTRVNIQGGPLQANPTANDPAICLYESTRVKALPSGGSDDYTYSWRSEPLGFTSSEAEPTVTPIVTTTYWVTIYDGFNSIEGSVKVAVNPLPQINLVPDDPKVQQISATQIGICVYDTVILNAGNPGADYLWSNGSSDQTIMILTSGISFDMQSYTVTVVNPETGCSSTANIEALFTFQNCSYGLTEQQADRRMIIYPNPSADGLFNVSIRELNGKSLLEVFTPQSQLLQKHSFELNSGATYLENLDMQGQPAGVYFLKLTNSETIIFKKLIIQ